MGPGPHTFVVEVVAFIVVGLEGNFALRHRRYMMLSNRLEELGA